MTTSDDPHGELEFRPATDDDIGGLVALLREAQWGDVDEATWRAWYRTAPGGPSTIVLAEDQRGAIVGQVELRPSRLITPDGPVSAARLGSFVMAPTVRSAAARGLDHPLFGFYLACADWAYEAGIHVIHALPHRVVVRAMASMGAPHATFGCVGSDLAVDGLLEPDGTLEQPVEIGPEFDDLWERSLDGLGIEFAVVRDAAAVAIRRGGHEMFVLRDERGRLRAYAIVRSSDGLLLDVLGDSLESIAALVEQLKVALAQRHRDGGFAPRSITALDTPVLRPVFERAGFTPVRYQFGCFALRPADTIDAAVEDLSRWYLTGGD